VFVFRYTECVVVEAVVMFTEGYHSFSSLTLHDGHVLSVVSLGGHIPIFKESEVENSASLRPPQFVFKSSARFPTAYSEEKNIQFSVFENRPVFVLL
jgi:hypothetical protein